ncbi:MAG TPA: glycosyltransferase family protein [Methylomusa anaerophila]|nr:glycosyltransferase family protein [Methylomusa anaerophila]HML88120.1 glycosyltransferase family protein [Methylomusa anaerophila]
MNTKTEMNANKICFITCVNNDDFYRECLLYINNLEVPAGYNVETLAMKDSLSMTSAFNKTIRQTDAKYKVYLHQDVYIINKYFIRAILNVFSNPQVGMIGVAGCAKIPASGIWWESGCNYGKVYDSHTGTMELLSFQEIGHEYKEVQGIDGLIMITQYDLPWREDIFTGWHFYDVSQCLEFIRAGYKVVIPQQHEPWCIHDCGIVNISNGYDDYRKVFLNEYFGNLIH